MLVADIENLSNMVLESVRRALLPWRRSQILRNLLTWNVKNIFADLLHIIWYSLFTTYIYYILSIVYYSRDFH